MTNEHSLPVYVVKVGGSLFNWQPLKVALGKWLGQLDGVIVLIFGGGQMVDAIRQLDRAQQLDQEFVHWLCVDLLSISARIGAQLVPHSEYTNDLDRIRLAKNAATFCFDCGKWLRENVELETSWSVTSDSISAVLAKAMNADRLYLLKSKSAPNDFDFSKKGEGIDLVDEKFSDVISGVQAKVEFINLRELPFAETGI